MSIASITGTSRVTSPAADTAAASSTTVRQATSADTAARVSAFETPTPPRFPWLSRLSEQLQSAAKQQPAFQPAPVIGDNVDKSA